MDENANEKVEVIIDSIRVSLMSQQRIVMLKDVKKERYLPIWIGVPEAESIVIALQEVEVVRPLTHDLLKKVFDALNAEILRVEVTALNDDIYYGNIVTRHDQEVINIDARPSDALALAVRANVPIYVDKRVFEVAGVIPDEDIRSAQPKTTVLKETELEEPTEPLEAEPSEDRLSVFKDFIEKLDLDNLDSSEEEHPE
jgi:bifunctional DNase/RNase